MEGQESQLKLTLSEEFVCIQEESIPVEYDLIDPPFHTSPDVRIRW